MRTEKLVQAIKEKIQDYLLGNLYSTRKEPRFEVQLQDDVTATIRLYIGGKKFITNGRERKPINVDIDDLPAHVDVDEVSLAEAIEDALIPFSGKISELRKELAKYYPQSYKDFIKWHIEAEVECEIENIIEWGKYSGTMEAELPDGYYAEAYIEVSWYEDNCPGDYWTPPSYDIGINKVEVTDLTIYDEDDNKVNLLTADELCV